MADEQSGGPPPNNAEKLNSLLTFDATKRPPLAGEALAKVIEEIKKEKLEIAQKEAKDLLYKAIELQNKKAVAKRAFENQDRKFDKELGRVLKNINNLLEGRPIETGNENQNQDKEEAAAA